MKNQLSKEAEYILQSVKYNEFVKVSNIVNKMLEEKVSINKIGAALRELREKGHACQKSEITKNKELRTVYIFQEEPNDSYKERFTTHKKNISKCKRFTKTEK